MNSIIPVVLFAYARPDFLKRTLDCLRENKVPLIYAFVDGPKTSEVAPRVAEVRKILRQIGWCEIHIVEREKNFGLGVSILTGVEQVFQEHDAIIVFEDDLICVPGTYDYLCAALKHYQNSHNVMSVTGWTHPRVTPSNITDQPYFDGRTDCLVWGTWKRAWKGMEQNALSMIEECNRKGIDIYRYGADLVEMAQGEKIRNIWAVRFSFLHILNHGICLRPPYSLVEHIGYDSLSSNVKDLQTYEWFVKLPESCPPFPNPWPVPLENPECYQIWQRECGYRPSIRNISFSYLKEQALEKGKRLMAMINRYRNFNESK